MQHDQHIEQLRSQGFRLTKQRMLILDVLRGHQHHLTADAIFDVVKQKQPSLDVATVYRTLAWLLDVGLIRKIDVGKERLQYEYAANGLHHHLICNICGVEQEIDNHVVECLQAHILEHYGFAADPEHVAFFGRCADCRAAEA